MQPPKVDVIRTVTYVCEGETATACKYKDGWAWLILSPGLRKPSGRVIMQRINEQAFDDLDMYFGANPLQTRNA